MSDDSNPPDEGNDGPENTDDGQDNTLSLDSIEDPTLRAKIDTLFTQYESLQDELKARDDKIAELEGKSKESKVQSLKEKIKSNKKLYEKYKDVDDPTTLEAVVETLSTLNVDKKKQFTVTPDKPKKKKEKLYKVGTHPNGKVWVVDENNNRRLVDPESLN